MTRRSDRRGQRQEAEGEKSVLRELVGWIVYFAVLILVCHILVNYVGQRTIVEGQSMENTLHDGDNLILDKITYRFREPKRYEVIVFLPYEDMPKERYIKRLIGLPGDSVQIIDGYVYVNGEALDEHYGAEVMWDAGIAAVPILLGENEYFVLGDNRNHSSDSRISSVGIVHKEQFLGRAWLRIYPFNQMGFVVHE